MHNKVLIVEDDIDIVELLRLYLESSNYITSAASDGLMALDILKKDDKIIPLTSTEMKMMVMFMKSPNRVFTKSQIYEYINGDYCDSDDNTMMVHISNLRSKLENNPTNPKYIVTVRGLGYKLVPYEEK